MVTVYFWGILTFCRSYEYNKKARDIQSTGGIHHVSRKIAVVIVMTTTVIIGSCSILIPGFLDKVDIITSNYMLVISGLLIAIFVGWIWGADNFLDAINIKKKGVRMWLKVSIKYVCPLAILVIFIGNFITL